MKNVIKFPLGLWVLLSTGASFQLLDANADHSWFGDSCFFDNSWFNEALELQKQPMAAFENNFANFGFSKEQHESFKAAQARLASVKLTISTMHEVPQEEGEQMYEDKNKFSLCFSRLEQVEPKDIKIVKKKHGFRGVITLKEGIIEFFISRNGVETVRRVELHQEKDQKKNSVMYSSSSAAESTFFESPIDLKTVKVEFLRYGTLTITAQKKQEEILPIPSIGG